MLALGFRYMYFILLRKYQLFLIFLSVKFCQKLFQYLWGYHHMIFLVRPITNITNHDGGGYRNIYSLV